jgi:A/G-specific adenine glycosylase
MITPSVFADRLISMSDQNARDLPWTLTNDPYKIWISEIILQQTRVAQGLAYYERFIERFPTVTELASAPLDLVLKMWEGLGYYSRARNLHYTAKLIMEKFDGYFPHRHEDIISLKGIGPYTAAAIASFAFGQKYAAIDGNALRVISRVLGITAGIDTNDVKKQINLFANQAIASVDSALFNQTIMDVGSLVCTPQQPKCFECAMNEICLARIEDMISLIPYKAKKVNVKDRFFHYYYITDGNKLVVQKRKGKDIWNGLYELPLIESKTPNLEKINIQNFGLELELNDQKPLSHYVHILTHQRIHTYFYFIKIKKLYKINKDQSLVERKKVLNFAFPRVITRFFEENDFLT